MEPSTTIRKVLSGNQIYVPNYQRAYSWDTEFDNSGTPKQVNTFLTDLQSHIKSSTNSAYYFGHFLFEEKGSGHYGVIDGQQRLTTIIIFLSALFKRLKEIRVLNESEDTIKRNATIRFKTVYYDQPAFSDYVIENNKSLTNVKDLETVSLVRIVDALKFFTQYFQDKEEQYILTMLNIVLNSSCSTHIVKDESEAIQMFIFQNNRGKKPSNLEIVKAQFMFNIHLFGESKKEYLIDKVKQKFEEIYRSISAIEYKINEDDVLLYALRVFFNSLWEENALNKINTQLAGDDSIAFIETFTDELASSFKNLKIFFGKDQLEILEVHSIISLGGIGLALPFILKGYKFGLSNGEIARLCSALESLVVRQRLIGTRAELTSRLNDVYQNFNYESGINAITERINFIKNSDGSSWWWAYWNNNALVNALQGGINHSVAKFLLWKYENHLALQGNKGYQLRRLDSIDQPSVEHIAPQTDNPESGYNEYDEEFRNQYINCLGNYLLISKSHNSSIGNKPFEEKLASYDKLTQQYEIREMASETKTWTKDLIQKRKEKIISFLMESL